jgi:hypothetical protein
MWSQEVREAFALFIASVESKFVALFDIVAEFISAYSSYILIGVIILVILFILDVMMKRQEKREKKKIDDDSDEGR